MAGGGLYSFTAQVCFQYLGDLTFCVPEMFDGGKFREKFVKPESVVVLFEMQRYFPIGCFDTCLKEKEDGGVIKMWVTCRL